MNVCTNFLPIHQVDYEKLYWWLKDDSSSEDIGFVPNLPIHSAVVEIFLSGPGSGGLTDQQALPSLKPCLSRASMAANVQLQPFLCCPMKREAERVFTSENF